ncbi:MAG: RHS repeat-associated core domain-containing protein [Propionivibrio sp.]|nr:RHS repeat-associated core domain-containing protein [Propionivibrio sp.]
MNPMSFTVASSPARAHAQARTVALVNDYRAYLSLLHLCLLLSALERAAQASRATDALNNWRDFKYDANGNLIEQSLVLAANTANRLADRTSALFDMSDRKTQSLDAAGNATRYAYDPTGNVTRITNPDAYSVAFDYDEMNRVTRAYDEEGNAVTKELDLDGKPRKITDANGTSTLYDYYDSNRNGKLFKVTDAGGRWVSYDYDENGNATTVTDNAGRTTLTTYDELNRPLRSVGPQVTDPTYGLIRTVTVNRFDPLGNLAQVSAGRTDSGGLTPANDTVTPQQVFAYDDFSRKIKETDVNGKYWRYRYDAAGRLTTLWDSQDSYLAYLYDQGARLKQKWLANGVTSEYVYNADNTLAQLKNSAYDFNTFTYATLTQHDLTYDSLGRKQTATDKVGAFTQPVQNFAYGFDPLGNRITRNDITSGILTSYVHDPATNQLKEIHAGGTAGALIGALIYDDAGNLVQKCEGGTVTANATSCTGSSVLALQYNADNRIAQASGNGASESYAYDDQGRRIRKTSNGSTTFYLYNGPDIVAEYEGDWSKPKAFTTHGPGTDDPVVRYTRNAGGTYDKRYYHQDTQNSSVAVTDANGTLIGTQLFDGWGNKIQSGTLGSVERYGYTGREPDATGLIYYRARYYDPGVARFTQRDPIGLQGGVNQYAYVGNSPVNYSDPSGLLPSSPSPATTGATTSYPNFDSGCGSAANTYTDDEETISDAEGREGIDVEKGTVRLAVGTCAITNSATQSMASSQATAWDGRSGVPQATEAPNPFYGTFQGAMTQSMQDGLLNAGLGAVTSKVMGIVGAVFGRGAVGVEAAVAETQVTLSNGQYINRVWDSRWTPGSSYSGPFGGSYSPGGALPINATTAVETRGLNIPGVLNNADRGGIYNVTQDIPATLRTSIGGTEPELLIAPQYRQYLNLIDKSISTIPR